MIRGKCSSGGYYRAAKRENISQGGITSREKRGS